MERTENLNVGHGTVKYLAKDLLDRLSHAVLVARIPSDLSVNGDGFSGPATDIRRLKALTTIVR